LLSLALLLASDLVAQEATITESVFIPVVLKKVMYTKKMKVGDPLNLETNGVVKSADGKVLVPNHAKLIGTVTLVENKSDGAPKTRLAIKVTRAEWKGGAINMNAVAAGQVESPEGSAQMITGGPNPHAASPLSSSSLSPVEDITVERDDQYATVLVTNKKAIDLPSGAIMTLTTVPE
jgi:hypothetical protein